MVWIAGIKFWQIRIDVWQIEVATSGSIWQRNQVRVQDCQSVLVDTESWGLPGADWHQQVVNRSEVLGASDQGRAVRKFLATEGTGVGSPLQRAHIAKIEDLRHRPIRIGRTEVWLDALCRQPQAAFLQPRHGLVVLRGSLFQANFLREEEKRLILLGVVKMRNEQRTADRTPEVLTSIEWRAAGKVEEIS